MLKFVKNNGKFLVDLIKTTASKEIKAFNKMLSSFRKLDFKPELITSWSSKIFFMTLVSLCYN